MIHIQLCMMAKGMICNKHNTQHKKQTRSTVLHTKRPHSVPGFARHPITGNYSRHWYMLALCVARHY